MEPSPGLVLILSGPAGSGKTTLCHRLVAEFQNIRRIVTVTTRAPREAEHDGIDYHFLDQETFERRLRAGEFLEHARVHGRCYGTLRSEVEGRLAEGRDCLLNIDVQGAASIRREAGENPRLAGRVVSIFITPPSLEELRRRLNLRASDSAEEVENRLENAREEMARAREFDYILETRSREEDFDRIRSIYLAEKMKPRNR